MTVSHLSTLLKDALCNMKIDIALFYMFNNIF